MQQQNRQSEQPHKNRQILFIIGIYLIITISSNLSSSPAPFSKNVIQIINSVQAMTPSSHTLMSLFNLYDYQGYWTSKDNQCKLDKCQGKMYLRLIKFGTSQNTQYQLQFKLNNGQYIDEGKLTYRFILNTQNYTTSRNNKQITMNYINSNSTQQKLPVYFLHQKILQTVSQRIINMTSLKFTVHYKQQIDALSLVFDIKTTDFDIKSVILKQKKNTVQTLIFAVLLFILSFTQFSSVMQILKGLMQGTIQGSDFSIPTLLTAILWDSVICIIAFSEAFSNQQNLVLFIFPAFMMCLLFTNLQLRVLLSVFQAKFGGTPRDTICRFNIITYGSLILTYPFLIYTNLSPYMFLLISLIFIPQIYQNGKIGKRPDVTNAYYSKFLTFRFLIIVINFLIQIYLRCFPWNIFQLQPNYILGLLCVLFLIIQIGLIWAQKLYGAKKILPRFLLPPVFNYSCQVQMLSNDQQQQQCAICLASLNSQPQQSQRGQLTVPFRIMRGPCGHRFHGNCLGQWMQIKMQCPQCRAKLPPFE